MRRLLLQTVILVFSLITLSASGEATDSPVWLLDLDGPVGPASADYLIRGIADAEEAGATAVILRMDTPGGLDGAMRDIIHSILEARIPIIGYVAPQGSRAASAGTYILYACHIAAMAPATSLGAATPVQIGGGSPGFPGTSPDSDKQPQKEEDRAAATDTGKNSGNNRAPEDSQSPSAKAPSSGDAMHLKVVNDARAYIRGLAELRGRNVQWAESAVTEAATLTASEALEMNVINLVAENLEDLLTKVDGRTVSVRKESVVLNTDNVSIKTIAPDWRTRFLGVITNPSVAYILLMVGIYGLILEFSNPGIGAGGIVGAICLFLALYALQLLPISYSALGLLLFGLGLMVAEALSPSFGILGLGGIAAFVVGSIMLMDTDVPGFQIALPLILSLAVVSAGLLAVVMGMLIKIRHRAVVSGTSTMIGTQAVVTDIRNDHVLVKVQGELWQAYSDDSLSIGDHVRVKGVTGLQLDVKKENKP